MNTSSASTSSTPGDKHPSDSEPANQAPGPSGTAAVGAASSSSGKRRSRSPSPSRVAQFTKYFKPSDALRRRRPRKRFPPLQPRDSGYASEPAPIARKRSGEEVSDADDAQCSKRERTAFSDGDISDEDSQRKEARRERFRQWIARKEADRKRTIKTPQPVRRRRRSSSTTSSSSVEQTAGEDAGETAAASSSSSTEVAESKLKTTTDPSVKETVKEAVTENAVIEEVEETTATSSTSTKLIQIKTIEDAAEGAADSADAPDAAKAVVPARTNGHLRKHRAKLVLIIKGTVPVYVPYPRHRPWPVRARLAWRMGICDGMAVNRKAICKLGLNGTAGASSAVIAAAAEPEPVVSQGVAAFAEPEATVVVGDEIETETLAAAEPAPLVVPAEPVLAAVVGDEVVAVLAAENGDADAPALVEPVLAVPELMEPVIPEWVLSELVIVEPVVAEPVLAGDVVDSEAVLEPVVAAESVAPLPVSTATVDGVEVHATQHTAANEPVTISSLVQGVPPSPATAYEQQIPQLSASVSVVDVAPSPIPIPGTGGPAHATEHQEVEQHQALVSADGMIPASPDSLLLEALVDASSQGAAASAAGEPSSSPVSSEATAVAELSPQAATSSSNFPIVPEAVVTHGTSSSTLAIGQVGLHSVEDAVTPSGGLVLPSVEQQAAPVLVTPSTSSTWEAPVHLPLQPSAPETSSMWSTGHVVPPMQPQVVAPGPSHPPVGVPPLGSSSIRSAGNVLPQAQQQVVAAGPSAPPVDATISPFFPSLSTTDSNIIKTVGTSTVGIAPGFPHPGHLGGRGIQQGWSSMVPVGQGDIGPFATPTTAPTWYTGTSIDNGMSGSGAALGHPPASKVSVSMAMDAEEAVASSSTTQPTPSVMSAATPEPAHSDATMDMDEADLGHQQPQAQATGSSWRAGAPAASSAWGQPMAMGGMPQLPGPAAPPFQTPGMGLPEVFPAPPQPWPQPVPTSASSAPPTAAAFAPPAPAPSAPHQPLGMPSWNLQPEVHPGFMPTPPAPRPPSHLALPAPPTLQWGVQPAMPQAFAPPTTSGPAGFGIAAPALGPFASAFPNPPPPPTSWMGQPGLVPPPPAPAPPTTAPPPAFPPSFAAAPELARFPLEMGQPVMPSARPSAPAAQGLPALPMGLQALAPAMGQFTLPGAPPVPSAIVPPSNPVPQSSPVITAPAALVTSPPIGLAPAFVGLPMQSALPPPSALGLPSPPAAQTSTAPTAPVLPPSHQTVASLPMSLLDPVAPAQPSDELADYQSDDETVTDVGESPGQAEAEAAALAAAAVDAEAFLQRQLGALVASPQVCAAALTATLPQWIEGPETPQASGLSAFAPPAPAPPASASESADIPELSSLPKIDFADLKMESWDKHEAIGIGKYDWMQARVKRSKDREVILREIEFLRLARHDEDVVPIIGWFDEGPAGEFIGFVTEVRGISLRVWASSDRSNDAKLQVSERLASAVAYVNALGIIINDIRPANVQVGYGCAPRLVDFELATFKGEKLIDSYFEYFDRESLDVLPDEQSDSWLLGATIWEMWAGKYFYASEKIDFLAVKNTTMRDLLKKLLTFREFRWTAKQVLPLFQPKPADKERGAGGGDDGMDDLADLFSGVNVGRLDKGKAKAIMDVAADMCRNAPADDPLRVAFEAAVHDYNNLADMKTEDMDDEETEIVVEEGIVLPDPDYPALRKLAEQIRNRKAQVQGDAEDFDMLTDALAGFGLAGGSQQLPDHTRQSCDVTDEFEDEEEQIWMEEEEEEDKEEEEEEDDL
ncbi:hypothetical protein HDU96_009532 [Phlyctochytrium bullatum]|nr:hypothetical protein HDU96_009532 [Phlyctochytrium bullatum]